MKPEQCQSMTDIRNCIDEIDQQIVSLIGKRAGYVHAAAKFKTSEFSVKAPDRVKAALAKRREWAEENGVSPDVIEKLYTDLIYYFINKEMDAWKETS